MLRTDSSSLSACPESEKNYECHDDDYGVAILSIAGKSSIIVSEINDVFMQLTDKKQDDLVNVNLHNAMLWGDDGQLCEAIYSSIKKQKSQTIEWQLASKNNACPIKCSIIPAFSALKKSTTVTLVVTKSPINSALNEQFQASNNYDILTGLPNQKFLNEAIHQKSEENTPYGDVALLLINIHRFQRINESYGYEFGDKVIQSLARNLESFIPDTMILSRFSGDKFALLLTDQNVPNIQKEAEAIAGSLHHYMKVPITVGEQDVYLSLTIGIAISSPLLENYHAITEQAHMAMQRLKNSQCNKTLLYQPELQIKAKSKLKLENDLRYALKEDGLSVNYQPIISLNNGELIGFEALCRWEHPTLGMVSPIEFIPIAEENGLIIPLGQWVLRQSCETIRTWMDKYPNTDNMVINVNVSGLQLLQDDFVANIKEILLSSGIKGHNLKLELTETILVENAEVVRDILLDLKALNIGIAIDDFGTGYSSLSYLNQFPIDTLKIDKVFVSRMSATKDSYKIIHTISTLAQTLGLDVVAEGIELKGHLNILRKLGCQMGQGFLFSKPLSTYQAENYIKTEIASLA